MKYAKSICMITSEYMPVIGTVLHSVLCLLAPFTASFKRFVLLMSLDNMSAGFQSYTNQNTILQWGCNTNFKIL